MQLDHYGGVTIDDFSFDPHAYGIGFYIFVPFFCKFHCKSCIFMVACSASIGGLGTLIYFSTILDDCNICMCRLWIGRLYAMLIVARIMVPLISTCLEM